MTKDRGFEVQSYTVQDVIESTMDPESDEW